MENVNILIVDDHHENIVALKAILDQPEYNLVTANNGREALAVLLKYEFALILLDVFMPEMDGFDLATMIKRREKTAHIPIIFLTAMAKDMSQIYKAYEIGAVDYIQKPYEGHVVRAKVAVFADLFRKSRQIRRQAELLRQKEIKEKEYQLIETKLALEKRFQDLVEGINHGIVWSADPMTLKFTYVSPRAEPILGYPLKQWHEEEAFWARHVYPGDLPFVLEAFKRAQAGKDLSIEHRFVSRHGEIAWLHTGVRLARKGQGVGHELRGISIDITHLKNVEEALREALRSRDEFLSIASHELKTPLTSLKLQIQMSNRRTLSGDRLTDEQLSKIFDVANKSVDRLTSLVDDLLDVSKIQSGKLSFTFDEVNLGEVIEDVIERFHDQATAAGSPIKFTDELNTVASCDRFRMEQVVTNLISNAIKYGSGTPIIVRLDQQNGNVRLSVKDFGPGIEKEMQSKIFQRFERATSAKYIGGLGLGLYISRQIVEGHEGQIRVVSDVGQGSDFIVTFPLKQESLIRRIASRERFAQEAHH